MNREAARDDAKGKATGENAGFKGEAFTVRR